VARDGESTRQKIMDVALDTIMSHGYSATSIDKIIEQVGITKGAFFYHFKSKNDLAKALIDNYAEADLRILGDGMARAEKLSRDPLQQVLIFVGLLMEMMEGLEEPAPGCLFATYISESALFEGETLDVISRNVRLWREALVAKFEQIAKAHPPRADVDIESLADLLTGVIEGAYILGRVNNDPKAFAEQLRHYRTYVELLFSAA
jgi:TetR/AcrR family transcriptional repressor of nem operon